jgi:lysophospholipase L1-like esterase
MMIACGFEVEPVDATTSSPDPSSKTALAMRTHVAYVSPQQTPSQTPKLVDMSTTPQPIPTDAHAPIEAETPVKATRFRTPCLMIALSLLPVLLVINPIVMALAVKEKARFELPYVLLLDLLIIGILWLCNAYLRDGHDRQFRRIVASLIALPFLLGGIELLLLKTRATWVPLVHGDPPPFTKEKEIEPDARLGWRLRPGYEREKGGRAYITVDGEGRRFIPHSPDTGKPTLHAFGDSFLFGMGVFQAENALNLVADRLDDRISILNYAVNGYGLDQMLLRLEEVLDTVQPGDLVLFAPISDDLRRNLIGMAQVCAHHDVGLTAGRFPRLVADAWRFEATADYCPELRLPFADLFWSIGEDIGWVERRLLDNADRLMARAKRLSEARGATFLLLFQPMQKECRKGRFDLDISRLSVRPDDLLSACDRLDPERDYTRGARDHHWNAEGNRWLADALTAYLKPKL